MTSARVPWAVVEDPEGDALDSLVAAAATFRALQRNFRIRAGHRNSYLIEGYVYF